MLKEQYERVENLKQAVRLVDLEGLNDITVDTADMVLLINYINTLQAVKADLEKKQAHLVARAIVTTPQTLDMYM